VRAREDADAGVRECMELMVAGRWVAGTSHAELAAKHRVAPTTVKDWATSASRVIRLALEGDKEDIRARMLATLDTVVSKGMQTVKVATIGPEGARDSKFYDAPDLRAVVSAVETQARLLGLITTRHDVTTRPSVAHLSRDEHRAELEKLAAEIAAETARLEEDAP
jgi:hypothetical protein